ncbi:hypothetical protein [Actinomadura macra]|uniref:hypothetical protein n=1 Tax=Actinomadura macra TaxID=46164 RepID=UPI000834186C|nr:hypothetical protein [Actinomadura macra]
MNPHRQQAAPDHFADTLLPAARAAADAVSAADAAARAAAGSADGVGAVYAASRARAVATAADAAADAAAAAARAVGAPRALDAAFAAVRAADAARTAVRAATAARAVYVAADVSTMLQAEHAAVAALGECERVFTLMAPGPVAATWPGRRTDARRLGRGSERLVAVAVLTLPVTQRARFREEWVGLLTELPSRRARARQACSLLAGAPRQSWVLRRPMSHGRA